MRFTAKRSFEDADLKSSYVEGMSYTVRSGPKYDLLRTKVKAWLKEGKVVEGGPAATVSNQPLSNPSLLERIKSWL